MLGRLLNTLSYRLNDEFRDWRKGNRLLRENAWPWYQKVLIAAGEHPVRAPLKLLSTVLLSSAIIWGYNTLPTPGLVAPPSQISDLEPHFFTLWTVQAAVGAMIYPIVIGFVTLLLQRRHSAKASLHIYMHDSAAILTGLSALFLLTTMGIQYLFIVLTDTQTLLGWLVLDGMWFLANILGVTWFLARTFDYLRPERRALIIRDYTINLIWPREIRRNLEYHLFHGAINYGWLPGPNYGDEESNSNTAILISSIWKDKGKVQVTENKKDKWFILDVRFRPLSWAILSWQRREERRKFTQNDQTVGLAALHDSSLFILPATPGTQFNAKAGICRTEGETDLRCYERWLVRRSFVLTSQVEKTSSLSISDILNELVADVQLTMEAGEEVAFRDALHELIDLHVGLIQAGEFITDTGRSDNYANLVDRDHAFEARVHDLWSREYRRLLDAAVGRLTVSDTYFDYMAHISGWLVSRLEAVRPIVIPGQFLYLSQSLHYRLNRWWSRICEEQGSIGHGPCVPAKLKSPSFTVYETAIKTFIGAWESLKNSRFPPTRDEAMTWENYAEITELYTRHLDNTLYMMFDSLSLGNEEGAEWMCDTLIKWWSTIHFRFDNTVYYIRDERTLTVELLQKSWKEASDVIDLSMHGIDEGNSPKELWAACVHNYWTDLCCVSIYAIIQVGKSCDCEKSLPARLVKNLAKGIALRSGGETIREQWPIRTLEHLLIAILRQYYFDSGYHHGYQARLDRVIEGISSQGKPAMVPGRIYSGWGYEDLDTLSDGQLVLMCLLIKDGWKPSARLIEMIQKLGSRNDASLRAFLAKLEHWKTRLNEDGFKEYEHLFSCIQVEFGTDDNLTGALAVLDNSLGQLHDIIKGFRSEHLRAAQVSEGRMREIAEWCSRSAFSRENGDVPVSLFRDVQYSVDEYTEYSLTIREMNKGEFVEPPMSQRASNEEEWFERTASSHIAGTVMSEIVKSLHQESINVDSPIAYWEQIQNTAARIRNRGGTPILFIASRSEPRWLTEWSRSTYDDRAERPEDMRLVRDEQFVSDSYVGSMNDIPVFVAPISAGYSYLISKEVLDVLCVTEFENGAYVWASVEPIEGTDALINLKLVWRIRLELRPGECLKLNYGRTNLT